MSSVYLNLNVFTRGSIAHKSARVGPREQQLRNNQLPHILTATLPRALEPHSNYKPNYKQKVELKHVPKRIREGLGYSCLSDG